MKSINIAVLNPMFLGVFLGTGVVCIILVISSALAWHKPGAALALVGGDPLSGRNASGNDHLQRSAQ